MRLVTPYVPASFRMPCLIVSTIYNSQTRETALIFVEALNQDHALAFGGDDAPRSSEWVVIQHHKSKWAAIAYHLKITAHFINGGSDAEWNEGWEPYLALYEAHCPADFRKGNA